MRLCEMCNKPLPEGNKNLRVHPGECFKAKQHQRWVEKYSVQRQLMKPDDDPDRLKLVERFKRGRHVIRISMSESREYAAPFQMRTEE
jgi:hypothetical protein